MSKNFIEMRSLKNIVRSLGTRCVLILSIISYCQQPVTGDSIIICEGQTSTITCSGESEIKVVSARYGRYDSSSTCPHPSISQFNCGYNTLDYVADECNDRPTCDVRSYSIHGDPCPGTYKYTEINYQCVSESTERHSFIARLVYGACLTGNAIVELTLALSVAMSRIHCFQLCTSITECNAFQLQQTTSNRPICYALGNYSNPDHHQTINGCALYLVLDA